MNIWESQLITEPIELRGGFYRVSEKPGMGVEVDQAAMQRYEVDYSFVDLPRHVYRYARASGETTYYGFNKQELHAVYPNDAMPACEAGSTLEAVPDDGSDAFKELHDAVQGGRTVRRLEQ